MLTDSDITKSRVKARNATVINAFADIKFITHFCGHNKKMYPTMLLLYVNVCMCFLAWLSKEEFNL